MNTIIKIFRLTLSLIMTFMCGYGEMMGQKTDLQEDELTGHVRYMRESINPTTDTAENDPNMGAEITIYEYNKIGNRTLRSRSFDGSPFADQITRCDAAGKKIESISEECDTNGFEDYRWTSYRDNGSVRVFDIYTKMGKSHSDNRFNYDEHGELIENKLISVRNDSVFTTIWPSWYRYDSCGQKVAYSYYDPDKKMTTNESYRYDTSGHLAEKCRYKDDSIFVTRTTYKNNSEGLPIEKTYYNTDLTIYSIEYYAYDAHGNIISIASDKKYRPVFLDRDYLYEYDSRGNWTKKTEILKVRKPFVTRRVIEYY